MKPKSKKLKTYTLDQIKDEMIGPPGTPARDAYESRLTLELQGEKRRSQRRLN